ncbi:NAD-dependent epimerase/dehydratase family protein [Leifsonia shinshuensis]|uniref:NAD-dependent epimerase/dehydratase family protein n=1 Tax=Leifsonia shinshuensis TaxID=150026 RepID=A0A7G6YAI9_9MICO|nr:NAD-dependent epimerase/dehydratase family protein [Leifsonia shinshuensis]QNE35504.1 NAD-dependent epimerase/dehydratase family protein [Leifsonia shinshuensis]
MSGHVVLGGNGVAGKETVRALVRAGRSPVSVGRRPSTVDGATSATADLLDPAAVARVLDGAEVAYLVAGLPYSTRVWAQQWPVITRNVVDAALARGVRLVFLDNVYAYGALRGPMTEQTAVRPNSRKGAIRADVLRALDDAAARGLDVTIGRSADFYGPGAATSAFNMFGLAPIARGKPGTWLVDADQPHSLTYTPDLGEALAVLGTDPAARGRTWHLPTAPPLTGREYLRIAGGPSARVKVMGRGTLRIGALFSTPARETLEMAYQYEAPYVFESGAFERAFG